MEVKLDVRKSIDENAASYFEAAKKQKRRLDGIKATIARYEKRLEETRKKQHLAQEKKELEAKHKKEQKWFEKFRWFISGEGFLCIGGRDATSNEIVVKKHTSPADIVFHTQMAGSPFFVIQSEGREIGKITLDETACAAVSFSRAWKLGMSNAEVFYVKPEQLTKTPKSGEFLGKGAFIVTGKQPTMIAEIKLAIGITKDGLVMCGPPSAVRKNCEKSVNISQGNYKASDTAKKIKKIIGGEVDDIVRALPSGGCRIKT